MSRRRIASPQQLVIEGLDAEGIGLARLGERRVRVKAALPGEHVEARIVGRRKGAVLGIAEAVLESPAAERVTPECPAYPRCGGCTGQHRDYAAQLRAKEAGLIAALQANGVTYARARTAVASTQFGYRRKSRLGVRRLGDDMVVGFRESFGSRIVRMDACLTLAPPFDRLLEPLQSLVGELSVAERVPQLETISGDSTAALIVRHLDPLSSADAAALGRFERRYDVRVLTQAAGYDTLRPLSAEPVDLSYRLLGEGVRITFGAADFVQVNARINAQLVSAALAALAPGPGDVIGDLFCGVGNFSLPIARRGARVLGFEAGAVAIDRARVNAELNALTSRTRFSVADLYREEIALPGVTGLLLDPPRSGAGPELERWLGPDVARIVYVSCNPLTFASDAARLNARGFRLEDVGIYDMFPHTAHVETLGVFRRSGAPTDG
ncbi:MAG: 23S rRNA (uracil(1939)-C(5))-methyltransferase [Pseudomonadota bacterium]